MDLLHLKQRGWSLKEIAHAQRIVAARAHISAEIHYCIALLLLAFGSVCFALLLFPFLLLADIKAIVPVMLLLGLCTGWMYAHILWTLDRHHLLGIIVLCALSFVAQ